MKVGFINRLILEKAPEIMALLVYNITFGGLLSIFFEIGILEFTGWQWTGIRIIDNSIKYLGAGYCARLEDFLKGKLQRHPKDRSGEALASTLTLLMYQLPIYAATALLMRATVQQVLSAVELFAASTILTGWMYGFILDWMRKHFSKKPIKPS